MSEVFAPVKTVNTNPKQNTFVEVPHTLTDGVLLYRPDDNSFIALYPDEWLACRDDGHKNKTAIEELQDANRDVTEKSVALQHLLQQPDSVKADISKARDALDEALNSLSEKSEAAKKRVEAITSQKTDEKKLIELLPLTMKRMEGKPLKTPIYVSADKLKAALADKRFYMVEGAAERKKEPNGKLFDGTQLNAGEVRKRIANQVQDSAKFEKKWKWAPKDAEEFSGILTGWAKVMGADATAFLERSQEEVLEGVFGAGKYDPTDPHRMIDLKPEAQFMRWSAGAGAEANFMPFQGSLYDKRDKDWGSRFKRAAKSAQFGVRANAEASFAVAEAKVETILYLPHAAGWHLDTEMIGQPFDFGYFRLRGDLSLYALAGASVAIETGASLMITGDKQGVKGTPKGKKGAKGKVGAKAEAKVFAGLKEGIDLTGALQWLNPEGFINPQQPKKADVHKAIAAYTDVASVSAGVAAMQGLAASMGFECDYRQGNFIVAAKASACLGLGGSGNVAGKVGAAQIGNFFMCIAHQLKQADYKKMSGLMSKEVFATLNQIYYLVVVQKRKLESFIGHTDEIIEIEYKRVLGRVRENGDQLIREIEQELKSGWGWFAYMPPESRGAVIRSVVDVMQQPQYANDMELRQSAAFSINELVATTQSSGHLDNTLDRITIAMGEVTGRNEGIQQINLVVAGTTFANCVNVAEMQLAKASPLMGRSFLRNDEPDFIVAQFPLHHPAYNFV